MTVFQNLSTILRLESSQYQAGMTRAVVQTRALSQAIGGVNRSLGNLNARTATSVKAMDAHAAGSRRMQRYALQAAGANKSLANSFTRMEGGAGSLRRVENAVLATSAVLAGFGGVALKSAIDYETAFTGVIKTVDATDAQLATLRTGILDMSEALPASATEIAGVAEVAGQLGVQTDSILGFSKVMIDLGESTVLNAKDSATALAKFSAVMGTSDSEISNIGSTIVDLGNNFATTEDQIVNMSTRVAGAAASVGLSADEVLAFSTALSSVGVAAERGGTAISRILFEINTSVEEGGTRLQGFADIAGTSADEFATTWEERPAEALTLFIEGIGRMSREGQNVSSSLDDLKLSGVRVQQSLLSLGNAGSRTREAFELGSEAFRENTALAVESGRRYATTESQIRQFGNTLRRDLIDTGTEKLPAILDILEKNAESLPELIEKLAEAGINLLEAFSQGLPILEGVATALTLIPPEILAVGSAFSIAAKVLRGFGPLLAGVRTQMVATAASAAAMNAQMNFIGPLNRPTGTPTAVAPRGAAAAAVPLAAGALVGLVSYTEAMDKAQERASLTADAVRDLEQAMVSSLSAGRDFSNLALEGLGENEFDLTSQGRERPDNIISGIKYALDFKSALSGVIDTVNVLGGEYEVTNENLEDAGVSQSEFVSKALQGGTAAESLSKRIGATANVAGRLFQNAEKSADELIVKIREDAMGALEGLVEQGIVTDATLDQVLDSTRGTTFKYETVLEERIDPDSGDLVTEAIEVPIEVTGEEDVEEATEKLLRIADAIGVVSTAASDLGLPGDAVASFVEGFAVDESGFFDFGKAEQAVAGLNEEVGSTDLARFDADTLQLVGTAAAMSTEFDSVSLAVETLNDLEADPDLSAIDAARLIAQQFNVDLVDLIKVSPRLQEAFQTPIGAADQFSDKALAAAAAGKEFTDSTTSMAAAQAAVKTAISSTAVTFSEYGYSAESVEAALANVEKVSAEAGAAVFSLAGETDRHQLSMGLLSGEYDVAAEAANALKLSEQELADVQAYLTEKVQETAEAYKGALPASEGIGGALGSVRDDLKTTYDEMKRQHDEVQDARAQAFKRAEDQRQEAAQQTADQLADAHNAEQDRIQEEVRARNDARTKDSKGRYTTDAERVPRRERQPRAPRSSRETFEKEEFGLTYEEFEAQNLDFQAIIDASKLQIQESGAFVNQVKALLDRGEDDLALTLVNLAESDSTLALDFVNDILKPGQEATAADYELILEAVEVGNIALDQAVLDQSVGLSDTKNRVLEAVQDGAGEGSEAVLDKLREIWGPDFDVIVEQIKTRAAEIEDALAPSQASQASDVLFAQFGTTAEETLLLLKEGGADALNRDLARSILLLDGFGDTQANEILRQLESGDLGDLEFTGIITDALADLDAISEEERTTIMFAKIDEDDAEDEMVSLRNRLNTWAADRDNFIQLGAEIIGGPGGRNEDDDSVLRSIFGQFDVTPEQFRTAAPQFIPDQLKRQILGGAGTPPEEIETLLKGDPADLKAALDEAYSELLRFETEEYDAVLGVDDSNLESDVVGAINRAQQNIDPLVIPTELQAPTSDAVRQVLFNIDAAVRRASGGKYGIDSPEFQAGASVFNSAVGGIVQFAKGGMSDAPHVAQIAKAGAWRVWAEPETGGEAYIPLSPAKRPRSLKILHEVAKRMDYYRPPPSGTTQRFAAGGIVGSQPIRVGNAPSQVTHTSHTTTTHVEQPVNFQGDLTFPRIEEAVEYAQRQRRKNALIGLN